MKKSIIPTMFILLLGLCAGAQTSLCADNATKSGIFNRSQIKVFPPYQIPGDTIAPDKRAYYTEKSKSQKTAAWILLAGGTTLIGVGFLIGNRSNSSFEEAGIGLIVGSAGVAACIGSIPLFISARKYKAKATLSLSFQKTAPSLGKQISALCLKIPFG